MTNLLVTVLRNDESASDRLNVMRNLLVTDLFCDDCSTYY